MAEKKEKKEPQDLVNEETTNHPQPDGDGDGEQVPPEQEAVPQSEETDAQPDELEALQARYDQLNDKHLRLMAEYDNFRKRSQKERDDIYPTATANAVGKFLPVLDNFERADQFPHGDDDFGKGFDKIYQSFREVLTNLGVEEIGEVGEPFDPTYHNAVMRIEDEALGENVVAQVLQKGYRIGDKIIRYAMVQTAN